MEQGKAADFKGKSLDEIDIDMEEIQLDDDLEDDEEEDVHPISKRLITIHLVGFIKMVMSD